MQFFPRRRPHSIDSADTGDDLRGDPDNRRVPENAVRRGIVWGSTAIVLLLLGLGAWVAVGAVQVKSNLEQARDSAQDAKDALLDGDTAAASESADNALGFSQAARDASHSLGWNIAASIPWLGSPFKTGQQVTDVVLGLASDILRPAADVGLEISPDRLYRDGQVDVELLRSQEPQLRELSAGAKRLNGEAAAITDPRFISLLSDARSQLQNQIADITSVIENTALAARLAPSMMGADGPRTYFMGFQTNAEVRGTGGLLGGYGILRFDKGVPTVDTLAPNTDLSGAVAPVDFGFEYDQQYGYNQPFFDIRNSNSSPHFPYAAQIWRGMWLEQTGMEVDGAIAIDPVALSYILGAVGAIKMPDGEVVSKDNVVELTEETAYSRFSVDQRAERKQYLEDIANAVVSKMTGPVKSPRKLLEALGQAASERRIAVWSAVPEEQQLLEGTQLALAVPEDPAPYAQVVINNLGGNKLDYYMRGEIEYAADDCRSQTRASTVTVKLTSDVPEGLPDYVVGAEGLSPELGLTVPPGTNVTSVRLVATKGSELANVLLNGERVPAILYTELGHPVFEVQLIITPGQTANVMFQLSEPTVPGNARAPVLPLVETVVPKVLVPECTS